MVLQMVTYDASPAAGASEHCIQNVWTFFQSLMASREDQAWRSVVSDAFATCQPLSSSAEVEDLAYWVQVMPNSLQLPSLTVKCHPSLPFCEDIAQTGVLPPRLATCQLLASSAEVEDLAYWVQVMPNSLRLCRLTQ